MTTIKDIFLDNGLEISFSDKSNRYFGDYHRICVIVTISYAVDHLADDVLRLQAAAVHGERIEVTRHLVRMAVPSAECEQVRKSLVDDFMRHAVEYLSRPNYPRLLVAAKLRKTGPRGFHV